jgi:hypothetical protein
MGRHSTTMPAKPTMLRTVPVGARSLVPTYGATDSAVTNSAPSPV